MRNNRAKKGHRTRRRWLLFLASPLLAGLAAAAEDSAGSISRDRRAELSTLLVQDCGSCHGLTLKGGLGKPLLPENLSALSEEAIAAIILDGISGTPMPPWRGFVTEAEALWLARALKEGEIR